MGMLNKALSGIAKQDPQVAFQIDPELGVVKQLHGRLDTVKEPKAEALRAAGLGFMKRNPDLFGEINTRGFKMLTEAEDPNGGLSVTLQQFHGRARVFGGSVRFHATRDGLLDTISNRLFPDLGDLPAEPRLSPAEAIEVARKATKSKNKPDQKPELLVYRHKGKPNLAWEVRIVGSQLGERGVPPHWVIYIDATDGKVIEHYDNIQTAGPSVGNGSGYYSGAGALQTWFTDLLYQLRDTSRGGTGGPEIRTDDEDGASPSEDTNNNWNDLTATPRDQNQGAEVDAHRYAAQVVDYFRAVHGRNSFDDAGGTVRALVHVGTDYNNGYWDGAKVNLGDGDGTNWDYCTSDDWLAHELTHAVTQYTCGLQYLNESGALNEAFSDIFAAFITGDWLVFEDNWLSATAPAARNMIDPTNGGQWDVTDPINSVLAGHQPSHYDDRYTGAWDNGGVHVNSGIINNLFQLLTVGGTHTTSGVTVAGIGQAAAEQLLYRCMTNQLVGNPTADFLDFRAAMLDACAELFPTDLVMFSQVKNAFNAVGIGPDLYARDNLADSGQEPYAGSYLYASPDIINRTSLSADPVTDFGDMSNDSLWQNVEFGQDNFVYARVQNRGNAPGDASIAIYFSSATTFGTPAAWIHIGTMVETAIAPGDVRISGPLTFPAGLIPAPGHYCMIAVISDALDPAPDHNLITSVSDYLYFVRNSNNIAYRNMDVVDLVPAMPGSVEAVIRGVGGIRERFDIEIDVGNFVPGARIVVRGPARVLDGAIPRGLRLAARKKGENLYEVMAGRDWVQPLYLARLGAFRPAFVPGFENVLVDEEFVLKVDYVLPEEDTLKRVHRKIRRAGFRLGLRQLWKGEVVGAVGQRFVAKRARAA